MTSTGSSSLKSITSAPWSCAISKREAIVSTAKTRLAPISLQLAIVNWPHGTTSEHCHGCSGVHVRKVRSKISRWENVRGKNGLIVGYFFRKLHQAHVRERNAGVFCLQSLKRTGGFGPPKNAVPASFPLGFVSSHCAK
jgi:hypothetical protein